MKKALLLLLVLSLPVMAGVIPKEPHIYVEGFKSIDVSPDQVKFSLSIRQSELDAAKAKANVESRLSTLLKLTRNMGIADDDVSASPFQITPSYEWRNGKRQYKGTEVSVTIYVMLNDVSRYAQAINTFVDADITSIINSQAMLSNEREIKQKVMKMALADAKQKANDLASLQDKSIKDVHSISEFFTRQDERYSLRPNSQVSGNSLNRPPVMEMKSASSDYSNLKMGTMKASATVYVVYTLK